MEDKMKLLFAYTKIFLLTIVAVYVASSSAATKLDLSKSYWVIVPSAPMYDKPNGTPRHKLSWVAPVDIDAKRLRSAPRGWLPVDDPSNLWMRSEDLSDGKFKKVTACWPIKEIQVYSPASVIKINFKPNGSGVVVASYDSDIPSRNPYKTHAYMSKNIVRFNALNKDKIHFFTAGYKPEDRHLYPDGSKEYTKQTLFSDTELQGCTNQPVVSTK